MGEESKKHSIYGVDLSKPPSVLVKNIRDDLTLSRGRISDIISRYPRWKDHVEHVQGLLTCGLVALHGPMIEMIEAEIATADHEHGKSFEFRPRAIGLDVCPGCFVCGAEKRAPDSNDYLHNIAAFVASKEEGQEIVNWFGGRARLDYRSFEPNWIQVKVGACDKHIDNLAKLGEVAAAYGRLRKKDVDTLLAATDQPVKPQFDEPAS